MTRWLDDDQQRVWRAWRAIDARLNIGLARQLACHNLSMQDYEVLVALTDVESGRRRVLEMAKALAWERSRLSHHIRRMETRGLVRREVSCDDARGFFVVLTDEGRRAIEEAAPGHVEFVRRVVFEELGKEQVQQFDAITSTVLRRLDEVCDGPGDAAPDSARTPERATDLG